MEDPRQRDLPVMGATPMLADFMGAPDTPRKSRKISGEHPTRPPVRAEDVADAAVYLATADFITGVALPVDGGRTI